CCLRFEYLSALYSDAATAAGTGWRLHQGAFRDSLPPCGRCVSNRRRLATAYRTLRPSRFAVARSRHREYRSRSHLDGSQRSAVGAAFPDPYDYLLATFGVCTSMTVGLYARRKQFPLENITVSLRHSRIYAEDCEECETKEGMLDRIDVEIELTGSLTAEQRAKLMEIAAKCPVHRTLTSEINIRLRPASKASAS